MTNINYLTIDLFLYDLSNGLGENREKITANRKRFWQRIYPNITDDKLEELEIRENNLSGFIKLFNPTDKFIPFSETNLDGYYYPVKIGDTYGLQIDYSGIKDDTQWHNLTLSEKLPQLQQTIVEHTKNIPGEMGETWLIWGQVTAENEDLDMIAKKCYDYSNIIPEKNWKRDLKGQGKFKNAQLYEVSKPDITPDGINRNHHLIICLFPAETSRKEISETIGKLQRNFLQLWSYRHKILWVYEQSRQLKQTIKTSSNAIQSLINALTNSLKQSKINLDNLQQILSQSLSTYHIYQTQLTYLQEQYLTISINLNNYQTIIKRLNNEENDLEFLNKFSEYVQQKLEQIKIDQQILEPTVKPLETFITTIQGIIELEKTKNERTLNNTIALVSVGISTASVAASLLTENSENILQTFLPLKPHQTPIEINPIITFIFAFGISIIIGLLSAGILWQWLKQRK